MASVPSGVYMVSLFYAGHPNNLKTQTGGIHALGPPQAAYIEKGRWLNCGLMDASFLLNVSECDGRSTKLVSERTV